MGSSDHHIYKQTRNDSFDINSRELIITILGWCCNYMPNHREWIYLFIRIRLEPKLAFLYNTSREGCCVTRLFVCFLTSLFLKFTTTHASFNHLHASSTLSASDCCPQNVENHEKKIHHPPNQTDYNVIIGYYSNFVRLFALSNNPLIRNKLY